MADDERNDFEEMDEPVERLFALEEAEQLLPELKSLLTGVIKKRQLVQGIDKEFAQIQNRILLYGGILPPHAHLTGKRAERDAYLEAIKDALEQIAGTGCVVKDLDQGLIDFPSVMDDEQVYLCWKLGEERIRFWHHVHEGFAGRKPIDPARRDDVSGSKPN